MVDGQGVGWFRCGDLNGQSICMRGTAIELSSMRY
uniref:Uncharacterized protein n=1 Tax=Anguilla anguilla TaxID=7936 RepID=A0A0E9TF46_ANGAN